MGQSQNNLAKKFAKKYFSQVKAGHGSDPHIASAARRVLQNKGSSADAEIVLGFYGVRRSGATEATRKYNRFRKGFDEISRDVELYQRAAEGGQGGALAQERLIANLNSKLQDMVSSKWMHQLAEKAAVFAGRHPAFASKILYAAGRGLRLGGAIGTAVYAGIAVGEEFYAGRERSARAVRDRRDMVRAFNTDPRLARDLQREVERNVKGSQLVSAQGARAMVEGAVMGSMKVIDPMGNASGVLADALGEMVEEYVAGMSEQEIKEIVQRRLAARREARAHFEEFTDENNVLSEYARQRKTSVAMLSDMEKNTAMDEFIQGKYQTHAILNTPETRRQVDAMLAKQTPLENIVDFLRGDKGMLAKRSLLAQEFADRQINTTAQRESERIKAAQKIRELRDLDNPSWRFKNQVAIETAEALWGNVLSRRQSVYSD